MSSLTPVRAKLEERGRWRRAAAPAIPMPKWREDLAGLAALPILAYAVLFPILRPLGELPLAFTTLCACVSTAALGRRVVPVLQLVLSAFATVWLAASLARVLPTAWTTLYEPFAAIRQWSWALLMPLFGTAAYAFLQRFGVWVWRHALVCAAIWYVLGRATLLVGQPEFGEWDLPFLYGVNNLNLPIFAFIYIFIFRERRHLLVDCAMLAVVFLVSQSSTHQIAALAALGVRIVPVFRLIPAALGVVMMMALLISPHFASDIYKVDTNSGVRAVMWQDASDAIVKSNGMGVGFGTEYIKDEFSQLRRDWWLVDKRTGDRLYTSTHSAFYDVAMRLGAVGAVLFVGWMASLGLTSRGLKQEPARIVCAIVGEIYCSLAVNPGLTSVNIFIGVAFACATVAYVSDRGAEFQPEQRLHRLWRKTVKPQTA